MVSALPKCLYATDCDKQRFCKMVGYMIKQGNPDVNMHPKFSFLTITLLPA